MTKRLRAVIKGIGSVLDIAPKPKVHRYIPREADSDRLNGDLRRIGQDMTKVFEKVIHGRRAR